MASSVNLIPTKGMTLPFISYGGSSLLASGLTIGLILALTRKHIGQSYMPPSGRPTSDGQERGAA
jgi:cell division protein FtsW